MSDQFDHSTASSRRGVRTRVAAAAVATMMAVGGAAAVAPTASAQELPSQIQASFDEQVSSIGHTLTFAAVGSYGVVALPYFLWVCPALGDLGAVDPQSCSF